MTGTQTFFKLLKLLRNSNEFYGVSVIDHLGYVSSLSRGENDDENKLISLASRMHFNFWTSVSMFDDWIVGMSLPDIAIQ